MTLCVGGASLRPDSSIDVAQNRLLGTKKRWHKCERQATCIIISFRSKVDYFANLDLALRQRDSALTQDTDKLFEVRLHVMRWISVNSSTGA